MQSNVSLNQAQTEAVQSTHGPLLVLAGAGAGKTRVITHRILEIIRSGVAPKHILAITFTNKAAGEMRARTYELLKKDAALNRPSFAQDELPFISTFHSLGLYIIKEHFRAMGLKRRPTLYDRNDSMRAVKEALKNIGGDGEIEPRSLLGAISRQKGEGVSAGEYAEAANTYRERTISSVWLAYERTLATENALDFDDLLLRAERFLRSNPEAREAYQKKWQYIHIDEYQDTNRIQARLAELLVGKDMHLCAVGDIDQTIYGWRGAEIANILSFDKKFPGAKIILLEENYRSTKNILAAANDIIAKNVYRREKNLFTNNGEGELISLYQAFDETDEAGFVARKISELMESGLRPHDFAVLYRANFQSRAIEEALLAADIPYQVVGTRFFERKEVKDILSFAKAALYDSVPDIARISNVPARGIGKVTLLKMLSGKEHELTGAVREKVARFRALLDEIKAAAETMPPSALITFIAKNSGIEQWYKDDKLEGAEHLENIRELVSLAARYDTLDTPTGAFEQFIESATLASDQDEIKDTTDAVKLMTVHAAKGLEFPCVFIVGLEEGLFPYEREEGSESDKEEERRLMYVAITRAEKKLILSYASYRTIFGSKNATLPSQFLTDMPQDILQLESPERLGKTIYLD